MEKAIVEGIIKCTSSYSIELQNRTLGRFREIVEKGTIRKSLQRRDCVYLSLNHKQKIAQGNDVEVREVPEGIFFRAYIDDAHIVAEILHGKINGCSFRFWVYEDEITEGEVKLRRVLHYDLLEVSILDVKPAYPSEVKVISVPDAMMLDVYKARLELLRGE